MIPVENIRINGDVALVDIHDQGISVTSAGIIVLDDDFTERGIRPRFARILKLSETAKMLHDFEEGDEVLLNFGEWSRELTGISSDEAVKGVWKIDTDQILLRESKSNDRTMG